MTEGRTILIVEDNEANMELAAFILEEAGFEVVRAMDGAGALAALRRAIPDVVLLDIHLPGTDGLQLLKEVRALPGAERVPVLALTAHAMRGDRERFLAGGFDGYIAKPISVKTFVSEILSHLA